MLKPTVYIETSVISYLTARASSDIRVAAHQHITLDWWENRRENFALYVSELVIVEAARGNEQAALMRLAAIQEATELSVTEDAKKLGESLINHSALPAKAEIDAFHVAVAAVNGINYLLTWNCKHIANAIMRPKIESICRKMGFEPPIICTPSELLES